MYGQVSPVQRWILGSFAIFAEVNEFPLDRLGPNPGEEHSDARRSAQVLAQAWGSTSARELLDTIESLVRRGHREDFADSATMAALPADARQELTDLMSWVDRYAAERKADPRFKDVLRRLVYLRYGKSHLPALDAVLSRAETPASPEVRQVGRLVDLLLNDREYVEVELARIAMLTDPKVREPAGGFMIWDFARVMMLYRWGHIVGWFTEPYCWEQMLPLAKRIQRTYGSWEEMAACYLQGRLLWAGGPDSSHKGFQRSGKRLLADPHSPWNVVPWGLTLRRDW